MSFIPLAPSLHDRQGHHRHTNSNEETEENLSARSLAGRTTQTSLWKELRVDFFEGLLVNDSAGALLKDETGQKPKICFKERMHDKEIRQVVDRS